FFFFQAEDGIRDRNVTGVQTCALPILAEKTVKEGLTDRQLEQLVAQINGKKPKKAKKQANPYELYIKQTENLLQEKFGTKVAVRSEERRVGKECRYWWWREQVEAKEK